MNILKKIFLGVSLLPLLTSCSQTESAYSSHWFVTQKSPKKVIVCRFDSHSVADHMLAESLSGLAAAAVNNGQSDEMVWLNVNSKDYREWYRITKDRLGFEELDTLSTWALLERFIDNGIVKGYVLYQEDTYKGQPFENRNEINESANVATVLASINQGVLIEESLESKATALGLQKLGDGSEMSMKQCFKKYKKLLNPNLVVAVDPKVGNLRDVAIAHKAMLIYGVGKFQEKVMKWMTPLSPVLGWNCVSEHAHTLMPSIWGHFNTASNWSMNIPLTSAGSESVQQPKVKSIDPQSIDFSDTSDFHCFVMSDGDNLQWQGGNFLMNPDYWANDALDSLPMGWTACPSNMSMANPAAWEYYVHTQKKQQSLIEYGGGYHYPDMFAVNRHNSEGLQRQFARRINEHLKRTGVKVFGFITLNAKSPNAIRAYQIFAEELDDIVGMYSVQYIPYEDGRGEVFWATNKKGERIPILRPKYSLWSGINRSSTGGPTQIAEQINMDAQDSSDPLHSSTVVHAWSSFSSDHADPNMPSETGVTPVKWCADKLDRSIKVIDIEELLWRIRKKGESANN